MERLSLTLLAMCQQAPVRSLRATIAASEQTLSDEARALWRQLARWQPAHQIFSEEELVAENVDLTALDTFFSRHMVG